MSTHKNIDLICVIITVLALMLTVLFMNGEALGIKVVQDMDAETYTGTEWFTANDQNGAWDASSATVITLQGDTAKVSGSGAYACDGGVVISGGGWYVLSGSLTDGSITVDADNSSKVWIRLDGVDVACSDDACLRIDQADKVFLTLGEGTVNTFTGGASYSEDALESNTGGVIFARDDLTINGSGSLSVTAQYKHGIDANDTLVITGGTIAITAPSDAIHVNDSFRLTGADLTINAGDDAIRCDRDICIAGGSVLIERCYEGLEALTVDIAGGDITIYPTDDGINANGGSGFGFGFGGFRPGQTVQTETEETEEAETYVRISGGTLTIVNENARDADGIDSNGSVYLSGGTIRISLTGDGMNNAIDFGSESGGVCVVTGGDVIACGGSSMTEAFSSDSTQCAVLYNPGGTAAAGTTFRVLDASGNEVLSYTPPCSYSSVAFSAAALSVGETYTVCIGEETAELTPETTATEISGGAGGFGGGFGGFSGGNRPSRPDNAEDAGTEQPPDFGSFPGGDGDGGGFPFPGGSFGAVDSGADADAEQAPDSGAFPGRDDASSGFPGGNFGGPGGGGSPNMGDGQFGPAAPSGEGGGTEQTNAAIPAGTWISLGLSALILLGGLLIAFKYKRNR